jgi:hypothetical protein
LIPVLVPLQKACGRRKRQGAAALLKMVGELSSIATRIDMG